MYSRRLVGKAGLVFLKGPRVQWLQLYRRDRGSSAHKLSPHQTLSEMTKLIGLYVLNQKYDTSSLKKIRLSYSITHIEVIYLGHVKYLRHNVGWHVTYQWYTICLGNERKFNSFGSWKKIILENYYTSIQCTYFIKLITHLFQFCANINNAQRK